MARKEPAADVPVKSTVTIVLKDEHERDEHHRFEVDPNARDRAYNVDGVMFEAARQESDGSWVYRKATI